jgi:hypothetical protein
MSSRRSSLEVSSDEEGIPSVIVSKNVFETEIEHSGKQILLTSFFKFFFFSKFSVAKLVFSFLEKRKRSRSSSASSTSSRSSRSSSSSSSSEEDEPLPPREKSTRPQAKVTAIGLSYPDAPVSAKTPPAVKVIEKGKVSKTTIKLSKNITLWPKKEEEKRKTKRKAHEAEYKVSFGPGSKFINCAEAIIYPEEWQNNYVLIDSEFKEYSKAVSPWKGTKYDIDLKRYTHMMMESAIESDYLLYVNSLFSQFYESTYKLYKGIIPKKMARAIHFYLRKLKEIEGTKELLVLENDIEFLSYIYHKLINTDLCSKIFDDAGDRESIKKILYAIYHSLTDKRLKTELCRHIDYKDNRSNISVACALWMKNYAEHIIKDLGESKCKLFYMFMEKCKLHHYVCPHTMNEVRRQLATYRKLIYERLAAAQAQDCEHIVDFKPQLIPKTTVKEIFSNFFEITDNLYKNFNDLVYVIISKVAADMVQYGIIKQTKISNIEPENIYGSLQNLKQFHNAIIFNFTFTNIVCNHLDELLVSKINSLMPTPQKIKIHTKGLEGIILVVLNIVSFCTGDILRVQNPDADAVAEAIGDYIQETFYNVQNIDAVLPIDDAEYEPSATDWSSSDSDDEIEDSELEYIKKKTEPFSVRDFSTQPTLLIPKTYKPSSTDVFKLERKTSKKRSTCMLCNSHSTLHDIIFTYEDKEYRMECCKYCPSILNEESEQNYAKTIVDRLNSQWGKPLLFDKQGKILTKMERKRRLTKKGDTKKQLVLEDIGVTIQWDQDQTKIDEKVDGKPKVSEAEKKPDERKPYKEKKPDERKPDKGKKPGKTERKPDASEAEKPNEAEPVSKKGKVERKHVQADKKPDVSKAESKIEKFLENQDNSDAKILKTTKRKASPKKPQTSKKQKLEDNTKSKKFKIPKNSQHKKSPPRKGVLEEDEISPSTTGVETPPFRVVTSQYYRGTIMRLNGADWGLTLTKNSVLEVVPIRNDIHSSTITWKRGDSYGKSVTNCTFFITKDFHFVFLAEDNKLYKCFLEDRYHVPLDQKYIVEDMYPDSNATFSQANVVESEDAEMPSQEDAEMPSQAIVEEEEMPAVEMPGKQPNRAVDELINQTISSEETFADANTTPFVIDANTTQVILENLNKTFGESMVNNLLRGAVQNDFSTQLDVSKTHQTAVLISNGLYENVTPPYDAEMAEMPDVSPPGTSPSKMPPTPPPETPSKTPPRPDTQNIPKMLSPIQSPSRESEATMLSFPY